MFHCNVQKSGKEDFFLLGKQLSMLQRSGGNHSLNHMATGHSTTQQPLTQPHSNCSLNLTVTTHSNTQQLLNQPHGNRSLNHTASNPIKIESCTKYVLDLIIKF
jgi:hypothetical protein